MILVQELSINLKLLQLSKIMAIWLFLSSIYIVLFQKILIDDVIDFIVPLPDLDRNVIIYIAIVFWLSMSVVLAIPYLNFNQLRFFKKWPRRRVRRVVAKTCGVYFAFLLASFFYWLIPEYGDWYHYFWRVLDVLLLPTIILVPMYVLLLDISGKNHLDGYEITLPYIVRVLRGKKRLFCIENELVRHYRAIAVKIFFIPIMTVFFVGNIVYLSNTETVNLGYIGIFNVLMTVLYTFDLVIALAGYIFALKLFGTHIRSTEPTLMGWIVCVICYPPFWTGLFFTQYFYYNQDGDSWSQLFQEGSILFFIWAALILLLNLIYVSSTLSFGLRFSNLTYRGLVNTGVYRYSRHPAYLSKNIMWWLIYLPMITNDDYTLALKQALLLISVNFLYVARAKTEENHLNNFEEYRNYSKLVSPLFSIKKRGNYD